MKTSVKKMNLRSFKLNRVYLDPGFGPAQNVKRRRFSWSWILKDFIQFQKQEGKFVAVLFTSSIKRQIRRFHVVIVQWTSRKWTKKRGARAELLFWSLKLLFFWSCFLNSLVVQHCPALVQAAFSEIWYWNKSFEHGSIFEVEPSFRYCESGIELTQFLANGDVPCEQSFLCGLAFSISEVLFLAVNRVFG